ELVIGGAEDGLVGRTPGAFHVWSAGPQTFGPMSIDPMLPKLPSGACIPCLLKAMKSGSGLAKIG
ncbi:hypothetical protein, partial [Paraherbaspirillum soli]